MNRSHLAARWLLGGLLFLPAISRGQTDSSSEPADSPPAPSGEQQPAVEPDAAEDSPTPSASEESSEGPSPAAEPEGGSIESRGVAEKAAPEEPAAPDAALPPEGAPPSTNKDPAELGDTASNPAESGEEEEIEVSVLGSKASRAAGSVHVIREEQLERFEYDDMGMVLVQVPGVYMRQEDGMGLRPNLGIRGANPDRSKKLTLSEDGVLFGPAPYSAPAAYFFPLLTRMTQVHVLKGPSAIAQGPQTVGGAIDLVSRPIPFETTVQLDLGLGAYGYNKGHAYFGTSTDQFGFLVEGLRLQNTGFAELPSGADTGSTRNEWMFKASYLLDPRAEVSNQFQFKFVYSDEVSNETYLGQSDGDFRENPYRRYPATALDQMKLHRTALSLTHLLESFSSRLKLKTTLYRHDYRRVWSKLNRMGGAPAATVLQNADDPLYQSYHGVLRGEIDSGSPAEYLWIGPNDRSFVSQGLQSLLSIAAETGPVRHKVEAGLRLHNDAIYRRHTEDAYSMIGGELIYAGAATITTAYNRAEAYALAAHVTDAVTYGSLTVTPGIRTELVWSELEDYQGGEPRSGFVTAFMPGAGIFYEIISGLGALAGVYRGFSPPPPASDSSVRPEYSVNYELGARYAKERTRLEVIGFYNDYQNMTDLCTLASGCVDENLDQQFDAGQARVYGLEAFATYEQKLPYDFVLPVTLAYTYSRGQFLNSFESQDPIYGRVTSGDKIPYLPPHQLSGTLALEHRYGGVNAAWNYIARMREVAGSGKLIDALSTDEQKWIDVGLFGRPLSWLTLYGNIRNLTGEQNLVGRRPYGARVNAPRWIQIGGKVEL